jgi:hypothetical protein
MSAEKSTNRARPLQASNVFRDSVEQGQPTMTPPASLVGSTDVQLATPPRAIPSGTSVNSEAQSLPYVHTLLYCAYTHNSQKPHAGCHLP